MDFEELKNRYLRHSPVKSKQDQNVRSSPKKEVRMNKILSVNLNNDNFEAYEKTSQVTAPMNLRLANNVIQK